MASEKLFQQDISNYFLDLAREVEDTVTRLSCESVKQTTAQAVLGRMSGAQPFAIEFEQEPQKKFVSGEGTHMTAHYVHKIAGSTMFHYRPPSSKVLPSNVSFSLLAQSLEVEIPAADGDPKSVKALHATVVGSIAHNVRQLANEYARFHNSLPQHVTKALAERIEQCERRARLEEGL